MKQLICLALGLAVCTSCGLTSLQGAERPAEIPLTEDAITFEQHVRPILKAHCFYCHGGEGETSGGLDLRLRRLMLEGGDSGPAIEPHDADSSYLISRVEVGDMPPGDKQLSAEDLEILRRWVDSGARTARAEPAELGDQLLITPEERSFWSFQPIQRTVPPAVEQTEEVVTEIDAFLLERLQEQGLGFAPRASRRALIERAYFDLLGLPPTPEEVERFEADPREDAYQRLVDQLLDSPHYGERWGRHWLDVAGYADSEGYDETDAVRPWAFRYRDWVIRALNADLPLDQFITMQLAGDELVPASHDGLTPEQVDLLTATGYLRMAADGTATAGGAQPVAANQMVADTIKIVSTSLLGLSVGCAQCHDHRYDPIPQTDYYRMRAVFSPALDWQAWRTPGQRLVSLWTSEDHRRAAEVAEQVAVVAAERAEKQAEFMRAALDTELQKFPEEMAAQLRAAYDTPAAERTPEQQQLLAQNPSVNISPGVLYQYNQAAADELAKFDARIGQLNAARPADNFVRALTEPPGHLPPTYLFHRGDHGQPRDELPPGDLTIATSPEEGPVTFPADDAQLPTSGRRLAYAQWLTSGRHPLVARVLANRIWMHHFGRPLVGTPADFGMVGEQPTHPELLDWLASDLMEGGWRMKRLHRQIMTSAAYQQQSTRDDDYAAVDPDGRLYGRMPLRRLEAEALRDAILTVSGVLNPGMFGPAVPVQEDGVGQIVCAIDPATDGTADAAGLPQGSQAHRRSVYLQVRRSQPLAVLSTFDAPVMEVNCEQRTDSTVATQSLMLLNSDFLRQQADYFARRVQHTAGDDAEAQIRQAWRLAYQRAPSGEEHQAAVEFLASQQQWITENQTVEGSPLAGKPPAHVALQNLCQVLLGSNEFLYVE